MLCTQILHNPSILLFLSKIKGGNVAQFFISELHPSSDSDPRTTLDTRERRSPQEQPRGRARRDAARALRGSRARGSGRSQTEISLGGVGKVGGGDERRGEIALVFLERELFPEQQQQLIVVVQRRWRRQRRRRSRWWGVRICVGSELSKRFLTVWWLVTGLSEILIIFRGVLLYIHFVDRI